MRPQWRSFKISPSYRALAYNTADVASSSFDRKIPGINGQRLMLLRGGLDWTMVPYATKN
jgi:hypothetical protein